MTLFDSAREIKPLRACCREFHNEVRVSVLRSKITQQQQDLANFVDRIEELKIENRGLVLEVGALRNFVRRIKEALEVL